MGKVYHKDLTGANLHIPKIHAYTHLPGGIDPLDISSDDIIRNTINILTNAFRIAVVGGLTRFKMVDGFMDEFEDQSGINAGLSSNYYYNSSDDYYTNSELDDLYKLLLHCNGIDGSQDFPDSSPQEHVITSRNGAQVDTAFKKWGTGAALFNGTNQSLDAPDSADWDLCALNTDNWTIDLWVRHADHLGEEMYVHQYQSVGNFWAFEHIHGTGMRFFLQVATANIIDFSGGEIADNNWHHVALIKIAQKWGMYLGGTQTAFVDDASTHNFTGLLKIATREAGGAWLNGHADEIRIYKGNPFEAAPDVGLTDTIDVPTGPYDPIGPVGDMILISQATTAEAEPDQVRLVLYEEDVDAVTVNTDLKAYASIDGGTTWAQATLLDEGDYNTDKRILSGSADVSGQSGMSVVWKITTHNTKELKIHGVGATWS